MLHAEDEFLLLKKGIGPVVVGSLHGDVGSWGLLSALENNVCVNFVSWLLANGGGQLIGYI